MSRWRLLRSRAPIWPRAEALGSAVRSSASQHLARATARLGRFRLIAAVLLAIVLLVSLCGGLALWRLGQTDTDYPGAHFNTGNNAVWLEHSWAGQAHTSSEYDALARRLRAEQVTYVYAHVGPLDSDGRIPANRTPFAAQLVAALHARMKVHVLAWIGQLEAASGQPADQVVDLADSVVRTQIAATAAHFVVAEHCDGVHYDIEPIVNNDARFLDLLDETRAALPHGSPATLSIAAQKWAPNATVANWVHDAGHAQAWWTSYYYAALASHVDQMVVMAYDTAMPTASLYQVFVKEQVQHILDALQTARHPPQLLIGIPTYLGDDHWHHAAAENMASGLAGVTAGLNSTSAARPFMGVAIYRFALTTDGDWAAYDTAWLGRR